VKVAVIPLRHQSVAPGTGDCDRCRCQGEGGPAPAAGAEQGSSSTPPPSTARTGTWLGLDDDEPKASSFRLVLLGYIQMRCRECGPDRLVLLPNLTRQRFGKQAKVTKSWDKNLTSKHQTLARFGNVKPRL